jgi:ribosome-binding protein aMBF1 (putative translation factor)
MKQNNKKTLDQFVDEQYGIKGNESRDELERGYETFKLGIMIREARQKANLTQKELADRVETKRSYISRIENDASDIRLSTLLRIIEKGLNGKINISVDFYTPK